MQNLKQYTMKKILFLTLTVVNFNFAQQREKVVGLESCETPNPNSSCLGAYFDLTLANSALLGNLNPSDYVFENYMVENDFSPPTPVIPINNFYFCESSLVPPSYVKVSVRHLTDPNKSFLGRIKLAWIKKPNLVVNNNSVYFNYLDSNGIPTNPYNNFNIKVDNDPIGNSGEYLSGITTGNHTITYTVINSPGFISKCPYSENITITGNYPTTPLKFAISQYPCLKFDTNDDLNFNLESLVPSILGNLSFSQHTIIFKDRNTNSVITNISGYFSQPDKFVDFVVTNNITSQSYSGEIKLLKKPLPIVTQNIFENNVEIMTSYYDNFLYSISRNGGGFSAPQYSSVFNNLADGNYTVKVSKPNGNPSCISSTNFTISTVLSNQTTDIESFSASPNPTKGIFTINSSNNSIIDSVVITDVSGKILFSAPFYTFVVELNLSSFPNGMFFAKITSNNLEKTVKIIKE